MNNYPLGEDTDPRAPWNQSESSEVEVEVWVSNTLSRPALIKVNDYKELPPDSERDEDGYINYSRNIDYSDCDLKEQYENQYYTIKEILTVLRMVANDINVHGLNSVNLRLLNRLANESERWTVDEEEVVIA